MDAKTSRLTLAGQVLAFCLACALLGPAITPGAAVQGGVFIKLLFLGRIVFLLALGTWFLRLRHLRWADMGLRRPRWLRFGLAIAIGLVVTISLVVLLTAAMTRAGLPRADYTMFGPLKGRLPEFLFWLLPVSWGSAALGEELLFRGFLREGLERLFGGARTSSTIASIVAQATLFGLLHLYQGAGGALIAGTIGLTLGFVWLYSGRNLWAGIVIHGLIDSSAMTAIYLGAVHS